MNRFRRLKEEKIKNILKAIPCMLALALVIGSVQGLGTYALFTDTEDITSNLAISTGDVDVTVSQGQTITDVNEGIVFSITNDGTLNQNISLNIEADENLSQYLGKPKIYFYSDTEINDNISTSKDMPVNSDSYTNLINKDNTPFVLQPTQTIQGYIELGIDSSIPRDEAYELNLNVKASQIGELEADGFYDQDKQNNTVNINNKASIILEDTDGGLDWYLEWFSEKIDIYYNVQGTPKGLFEAIEELNKTGLNATTGKVISIKGSGIFSGAKYDVKTDKIKISNINTNSLKYSYVNENYIDIEFRYTDGSTELYRVEFRKDIKFVQFIIPIPVSSIEAKVTKLSEQPKDKEVSTEQEVVDIPKEDIVHPSTEEIEVPNEVEVEEPSTEEIEVPSEEVVEPSTEEVEAPSEEVVEPSTEEIEVPNEVEVEEPSTEEMEDLSEEVVKPSTEEIEAPSEEVEEPSTEEIEIPSEVVEPTKEEIEAPNEIEVILPSKEETEIEE